MESDFVAGSDKIQVLYAFKEDRAQSKAPLSTTLVLYYH